MGYGKKSGKGMQGGGKSSPSGDAYPKKASGLAMPMKGEGSPSGESYPAGDLSAKPA